MIEEAEPGTEKLVETGTTVGTESPAEIVNQAATENPVVIENQAEIDDPAETENKAEIERKVEANQEIEASPEADQKKKADQTEKLENIEAHLALLPRMVHLKERQIVQGPALGPSSASVDPNPEVVVGRPLAIVVPGPVPVQFPASDPRRSQFSICLRSANQKSCDVFSNDTVELRNATWCPIEGETK